MKRYVQYLILVTLWLITSSVFGASYSLSTTTQAENVLDRAVASGGSHDGLTKTQVLQGFIDRDVQALRDAQTAAVALQINEKLKLLSEGELNSVNTEINDNIDSPVVTDITNQTNNIGQSPTIPIVATDPDGLPLRFTATGLPTGMIVSTSAEGLPQITGTLTEAGTFNVVIHAFKHIFSDIQGTDTFTWTVNE